MQLPRHLKPSEIKAFQGATCSNSTKMLIFQHHTLVSGHDIFLQRPDIQFKGFKYSLQKKIKMEETISV
jgi:hypothetical protein